MDAEQLPDFALDRVSTVDQVASHLRELIWSGQLEPGARLKELPLSKSFRVSRNTVRDAIRDLTQDGLLTHELHRGAVVRDLTAEDVKDLYRTRRVLELKAVEQGRITESEYERIEQALDDLDDAVEKQDWQRVVVADGQFHCALVALLRSPRINRFFDQIQAESRFVLGILWLRDAAQEMASTTAEVASEHRAIFDALVAGRRSDARRALRDHLNVNESRALATLEQINEPPETVS